MSKRPPLNSEHVVSATSQQVSTDLNGERCILHTRTGQYYSLNPVGARVWELVSEPLKVSDVCDRIQREYDVDRATCEKDVIELLESLCEADLVDVRIEPGA